jgi:hypothetical protein
MITMPRFTRGRSLRLQRACCPYSRLDQIYSFDRATLIENIPLPEDVKGKRAEDFRVSAGEMFDRAMQVADNAGATDEHRALNYLAVRYPRSPPRPPRPIRTTFRSPQSTFDLLPSQRHGRWSI